MDRLPMIIKIVLIIGLTVFVSISVYLLKFYDSKISSDTQDWGAFVTYVTGIAGLSLTMIGTYFLYSTFVLTSNNARESANFALETAQNARLQQFENAFFNLLDNQNKITNEMGITKKGRDFLHIVASSLEGFLKEIKDEPAHGIQSNEDLLQATDYKYQLFFFKYQAELSHYFRHLYHIVKYVHESGIKDRKKYVDIIQAQLSDDELYLTFFNCNNTLGKAKFKPLLDKYHFFENIRSRHKWFDTFKIFCYPNTIFKRHFDFGQI